jgi:ABC-type proline/glycine betaine transport system permease subunit
MAMPTIMAGVNQTLMLALAMSVIAGIVGGGGLGAMVYKTIMFLQIGKAFNAGLAIVIIAIVIDRLSEGMVEVLQKTRRET